MVMGLTLFLVAWRMTRRQRDWGSLALLSGAGLLAFGYSIVLPLYAAKIIIPAHMIAYHLDTSPVVAFCWHVAKLVAMNGGWLLFGVGLAHRAGIFRRAEVRPVSAEATASVHSQPSAS